MSNLEVIEGAAIALISATGGALLQDYLVRRADRKDRQVQFAFKALLELQAAIGDLAVAAEQIDNRKRSSGSWDTGEHGLSWRALNTQRVRTIRYAALVGDRVLEHLSRELEQAYYQFASARSEAESTDERTRARELLYQTNTRIGEQFRTE
jgi:hypothetical protein